jgi:hypothetical protein
LQRLNADGWKFIHLKRTNYLRHKISNLLLSETKITHIKKGEEFQKRKINVDCEILLKSIEYSEEVERMEEENLKNIPNLKIIYEKDLEDNSVHQETADKIFNYLGLKHYEVTSQFERMTPQNLDQIILNYDEVLRFFKDTKYFQFLN